MVTLSWTVVALVGVFAHAQDTGRVPDIDRDVSAVGNSARLDVDERPRQAQQSQGLRNSTSYSRWSLPPTSEASSSQFGAPAKSGDRSTAAKPPSQMGVWPSALTAWPHRTADSGTEVQLDASRKVDQQQDPFGGLVRGRQRNGLIGSELFNTYVPPPMASSPTDQLSKVSGEKPFGQNSTPLFPGFSSTGHVLRSKTSRTRTQRAAQRRYTGKSSTSPATK